MKTYTVAVEVMKVYHVEIAASSQDDAEEQANALTSLQIDEMGSLENVETRFIETVSEEEGG